VNHGQSIDSGLIEEHFRMPVIKRVPVRCNSSGIDFDVRVEVDDERSEGLGKGVDEGRIVERRG
jgi:hypothetical protein